MTREKKFFEAIHEATDQLMQDDDRVYCMGLGVPDPKGIFGTTLNLQKKYGDQRVMDMPTSENAMTGVGIGSAIVGMRPIMSHQRVDFFILALDQLVNNAAKWHFMFGGQMRVPIVIRLVIGRGWGQGPQHSQSLQSIFAHFPGLKVVMPSTPYDAKGLLVAAVEDDAPVVYLEHRWLHGVHGHVPQEKYTVPIGKAKVAREGKDVTIVSSSYMTIEALKAAEILAKDGISAEVVDLRSIAPLDHATIHQSVRKTGNMIVADTDWKSFGVSAEIVATVAENCLTDLKSQPVRVTLPDSPAPTSWALANEYYPGVSDLVNAARKQLGQKALGPEAFAFELESPKDVPNKAFTGPF